MEATLLSLPHYIASPLPPHLVKDLGKSILHVAFVDDVPRVEAVEVDPTDIESGAKAVARVERRVAVAPRQMLDGEVASCEACDSNTTFAAAACAHAVAEGETNVAQQQRRFRHEEWH